MEDKKTRILVVDDHPIIYQGLKQMITPEDGIEILGNAVDYDECFAKVEELHPDMLIIDIGLKSDRNGIDIVKEMKERYPEIHTMVLSMHDEEIYAQRAENAGAKGYVNKSEFTEKIKDAISAILAGETFFSRKGSVDYSQSKDQKKMSLLKKLTDREFEILKMIGMGFKNEEIAEKLDLKEKTIFSHKLRIKNKLKLETSADLLRAAVKWFTEKNI